ncbi:MAG: flagellar biosynthesis protein FlhF [Gammaproteobacteria bacterium]|nr:flagellar biosynthesis protein FlhF [Gammaproteobacteria bacterium]
MKIKRFFAADIRQAIHKVREALGPEAVILSNRPVQGGVEIVAAADYDEALFSSLGAQAASGQGESAKRQPPAQGKPPLVAATAAGEETVQEAKAKDSSSLRQPGYKSAPKGRPLVEWSQEPALVEMRHELSTLRSLLENQISGLAWGDVGRRSPLRATLLRRFMELGLSPHLCQQITDSVSEDVDFDHAWRHGLGLLSHYLAVTDDDILTEGGVVALVGPTGVGKTTTIAKLAARYTLRHGPNRVALVSTDSYRIGAHEQLRIYGRILNMPVYLATSEEELRSILEELRDKQLVLIDTAGMSQRDQRLSTQLALLRNSAAAGIPLKSYLVLSATSSVTSLNQIVQAFHAAKPNGCILTKLDEAVSLGAALSAVIEHKLPVAYVSNGQRVPEDIQPARAHSLIIRGVTVMQQSGEQMQDESLELALGGLLADAHL